MSSTRPSTRLRSQRERDVQFAHTTRTDDDALHAAGGIGKTVFVQSLAAQLGVEDEVVLFDCFGGGAYRTMVDGRHKPDHDDAKRVAPESR